MCSGFIQPAFVEKMLTTDDPAGFGDRQLIDFPPERDVYLDDLKLPIPDNIANLYDIFQVYKIYSIICMYII